MASSRPAPMSSSQVGLTFCDYQRREENVLAAPWLATPWDVVVVGGGHNGLVAAAYLAKHGLRTLVCERRDIIGGAAVSEHPFGPGYTVTSLSYVVSLLPADLVSDLGLERHGFHVYPQGPYFAPRADGRYLRL